MTTQTKLISSGLAIITMVGLLLWWLITSIEPATYMGMQDELATVSEWLLWTAAIGQTGFVVCWVTLPWWTHWVGRALMVKSLALMIYLDIAIVLTNVDYFYGLNLLSVILFGFVVFGIWSQLVTLLHERFKRNRKDNTNDLQPAAE